GANSAKGPMAERIRQALDKPITLKVQNGSLAEILGIIRQQAPGIPFHRVINDEEALPTLNLHFESTPLGALLQAVEDSLRIFGGAESVQFFVRDYGILATTRASAPSGAVSIHDFWKGPTDGHGRPHQESGSKGVAADGWTLPRGVEGSVKGVNPKGGQATIS